MGWQRGQAHHDGDVRVRRAGGNGVGDGVLASAGHDVSCVRVSECWKRHLCQVLSGVEREREMGFCRP